MNKGEERGEGIRPMGKSHPCMSMDGSRGRDSMHMGVMIIYRNNKTRLGKIMVKLRWYFQIHYNLVLESDLDQIELN